MERKGIKRKPVSEINVVPYIDVMLVLLVVFMVTAPLLTQGVSVELPEAPSEPIDIKDDTETVIVSVKLNGDYFIDIGSDPEKSVSLDYISERVQKMCEVGAGNLNWPAILEVCKAAGVKWYLIERDDGDLDPFESLRISLENLNAMDIT